MKHFFFTALLLAAFNTTLTYAQNVVSPKAYFGFNIGDDYQLINYSETIAYFKQLAQASNRVILKPIGKTEEGRTQYMAVISAPDNLKNIKRYKAISQKLARAELTQAQADKLIKAGKPVVWIDGGIHSTETVGSMAIIELYYQLLSRQDTETLNILDNVIILLCEANPDGQELVADWYMKAQDPLKREMNIPRKYNKYVGHDNNRDFYMMNMKESENISRQLYIEWMPQIVYDQHQSAPRGAVVAGPPYRGPFNYVYDPLIISGIDKIGAAMSNRLNEESKPGLTRLKGSSFNTWWNGGLRNTAYFHNMIGILTEIIGNPTPSDVPVVPSRLQPTMATPFPVHPQKWNFKKSIDYSIALNYAVLDYASATGDKLLRDIYLMGRNAIEKGREDSWTFNPSLKDSLEQVYERNSSLSQYNDIFKDPARRTPRGYIIPSDQTDFPTAVEFINALIKSGIKVYRSTDTFRVAGKTYPAGSYIVKTDQAFRPHVLDMFEPQHYPNEFLYKGGPPVAPYDAAGWTLALQMGIEFDRILNDFTGPFQQIEYGKIQSPPAVNIEMSHSGYLLSSATNSAFVAVNNLLTAGIQVFRITEAKGGIPAGSFYVGPNGIAVLKKWVKALGIKATPVDAKPAHAIEIKPSRIALFDCYGGYTSSGWMRWLLDQYHFRYHLIYPKQIDEEDLNARYDLIIFIDNGIPPPGRATKSRSYQEEDIPEEYWYKLGRISTDKSIPALRKFIANGGTVVTIGRDTRLAYHLNFPVTNALTYSDDKGEVTSLPRRKFYIPASILKVDLNRNALANWGMPDTANVIFDNNPVFQISEKATNIRPLASFGEKDPLVSGWAWGASYLKNDVAAFVASIKQGKFYAFGPEIIFRGQSHGTFKMLFNVLYQY